MQKLQFIVTLALITLFAATTARSQGATSSAASTFAQLSAGWLDPFSPHHVIGNIYYVGSKGLASFLITTPQGHILINSDLEPSVPQIRESVEKLGFKFTDIKILLISHAHFDHCAGSAKIKEFTGAKYMVMDADVPVVESGGKQDFQYGNLKEAAYPATKVDRVLHDGDQVTLGGATLVAHKTPGHTRGCTTWTMKTTGVDSPAGGGGRLYDVVIVGSPNVNPGYKLVGNSVYPDIAKDYEHAFVVWKSLPCDVFLGAHGSYYDMEKKFAQIKDGATNPFIDPDGYKAYIAEREATFRQELAAQQKK